ncbi:hypothetical protein ISP15_04530 [Dyella jejuensis]|uniref:DUF6916 domain-containing protein n=1 Tax=Dyella jejuensis TaxID=1432009 RepID=A0ABW8JEU9_9GAMM
MLDLRLEHFADQLDQDFVVAHEHGNTAFTLVKTESLSSQTPAGLTRPPFSLMFHNRSEVLYPQGIYTMQHPALGAVDIFLVPVERGEPGFVYQAVFN